MQIKCTNNFLLYTQLHIHLKEQISYLDRMINEQGVVGGGMGVVGGDVK